jgi:hypothetical protein
MIAQQARGFLGGALRCLACIEPFSKKINDCLAFITYGAISLGGP